MPPDAASPAWIPAVTAVAITIGLIAQIVLQVLAKMEAKRVSDQAKADALEAQIAASKAHASAQHAAEATKDVKKTLAESNEDTSNKLSGLKNVADATHTLVNNNMMIQLRETLEAKKLTLSTLARLTDIIDDPAAKARLDAEIVTAEKSVRESQKLYDEHVAKQTTVDQSKEMDEQGKEKA